MKNWKREGGGGGEVANIPGDEWEYPGKKTIGQMQRKPYDINLDEGFTGGGGGGRQNYQ